MLNLFGCTRTHNKLHPRGITQTCIQRTAFVSLSSCTPEQPSFMPLGRAALPSPADSTDTWEAPWPPNPLFLGAGQSPSLPRTEQNEENGHAWGSNGAGSTWRISPDSGGPWMLVVGGRGGAVETGRGGAGRRGAGPWKPAGAELGPRLGRHGAGAVEDGGGGAGAAVGVA